MPVLGVLLAQAPQLGATDGSPRREEMKEQRLAPQRCQRHFTTIQRRHRESGGAVPGLTANDNTLLIRDACVASDGAASRHNGQHRQERHAATTEHIFSIAYGLAGECHSIRGLPSSGSPRSWVVRRRPSSLGPRAAAALRERIGRLRCSAPQRPPRCSSRSPRPEPVPETRRRPPRRSAR